MTRFPGQKKVRLSSLRTLQHNRGFGLIEVLVALLVLAVGLLGMASLQSTSLQLTTGSQTRTQAILLAEDMIERIRANRENRLLYESAAGAAPACDPGYTVANANVVNDDLSDWRNALACLLPAGNGSVDVSGADNRIITVEVIWSAREDLEEIDDGELAIEVAI